MKILTIVITFAAMMALQSCAIGSALSTGSAVAGYSLQARTADSLSSEAEYSIIQKAKYEILNDLEGR